MKISNGLEYFISEALAKNKQEKFRGFISNTKAHVKFINALDHDLEKVLDSTKFVSKFSVSELEQPGDLYCSNGVTATSEESMINLLGKARWEGGWLLLNKSGKIAIYRPEGRIDDELYIEL